MLLSYTEDTHMIRFLIALFTLALASSASAQTKVSVDISSYVPMVILENEDFAGMCQSFQKKLGRISASGIITFRPKVMPIGQDERSGSVWIVRSMGKTVEIGNNELPDPLRKLRGNVVRNILQASCYTDERETFFNSREVVIVTVNVADADLVAQALR